MQSSDKFLDLLWPSNVVCSVCVVCVIQLHQCFSSTFGCDFLPFDYCIVHNVCSLLSFCAIAYVSASCNPTPLATHQHTHTHMSHLNYFVFRISFSCIHSNHSSASITQRRRLRHRHHQHHQSSVHLLFCLEAPTPSCVDGDVGRRYFSNAIYAGLKHTDTHTHTQSQVACNFIDTYINAAMQQIFIHIGDAYVYKVHIEICNGVRL